MAPISWYEFLSPLRSRSSYSEQPKNIITINNTKCLSSFFGKKIAATREDNFTVTPSAASKKENRQPQNESNKPVLKSDNYAQCIATVHKDEGNGSAVDSFLDIKEETVRQDDSIFIATPKKPENREPLNESIKTTSTLDSPSHSTQSKPPTQSKPNAIPNWRDDFDFSSILEKKHSLLGLKRKTEISLDEPPAIIIKKDVDDDVIVISDSDEEIASDADTASKIKAQATISDSTSHHNINKPDDPRIRMKENVDNTTGAILKLITTESELFTRTKSHIQELKSENFKPKEENVKNELVNREEKLELLNEPCTIYPDRFKPQRKPKDWKSDFLKTGSEWTIPMLSKYLNFKDTVKPLVFNTDDSPAPVSKKIRRDIERRKSVLQLKGNNRSFPSETALECLGTCETDARIILDVIFLPICEYLAVSVRTEEIVRSSYLPNNQYDYRFYINNQCVGCLEAKGSSMSRENVPQCILQLLLLQAEWQSNVNLKVDVMDVPFFNVLSDGFRFVFIILKGNSVYFEHQDIEYKTLLKVNEARSWENLNSITQMIIECMENVNQILPNESSEDSPFF
ncbi:unnamed protein product [Owenia fusiformis]|uniref:Uncharacterized protein n=1 Tax=Owenia fusiformis TaxID=6347 RepID=A0A8J1TVU0_OWEFU|nr:unnamed protein product [Owenia fusiformis]